MRYPSTAVRRMLLLVLTLPAQTLRVRPKRCGRPAASRKPTTSSKHWRPRNPRTRTTRCAGAACCWTTRSPTTRQALFDEALADQERPCRRAARPGAHRRRRTSNARAADLAKKALEADPKLVEAQELLARLALEDNNNRQGHRRGQEGPRHRRRTRVGGKAILATIDWLADKKETPWDPADGQGL